MFGKYTPEDLHGMMILQNESLLPGTTFRLYAFFCFLLGVLYDIYLSRLTNSILNMFLLFLFEFGGCKSVFKKSCVLGSPAGDFTPKLWVIFFEFTVSLETTELKMGWVGQVIFDRF